MANSKSYDEMRRQKQESQRRFYDDLFKSRDDGSYSIDKESMKSDVIDPEKLPNYPPKDIPDFD
ncbi:hypothetical protein BCU19_15675 [Vibrio cyclitrophicus]|uniref:hypothetical protein n=1 Tax=Vibrio TaxID=662 RepID=UPI000619B3AC|nr:MULTISPECIES: hypothetical protein [Vibrio]PMJ51903.1 hypothetical protein BCU19_21750 [Vibrio cyclitrophicus]QCI73553.1 hypothetical protein FAZ90_21370 [Vibrio cyclitrophicus]